MWDCIPITVRSRSQNRLERGILDGLACFETATRAVHRVLNPWNLTDSQLKCQEFVRDWISDLLTLSHRERFLNLVIASLCGYGPPDVGEPMDESAFSKYKFYEIYVHNLVAFEDKFDFLMLCVLFQVCRPQPGFEECFLIAVNSAIHVLDDETVREKSTRCITESFESLPGDCTLPYYVALQQSTPKSCGIADCIRGEMTLKLSDVLQSQISELEHNIC